MFTPEINFRGQSHGTFKLLFNQLYGQISAIFKSCLGRFDGEGSPNQPKRMPFHCTAFIDHLFAERIVSTKRSCFQQPDVYVVVGVSSTRMPTFPNYNLPTAMPSFFRILNVEGQRGHYKENIRLPTDSGATQAAVYTALSGLAKMQKVDLIFFYFSGHGDLENVTLFNNGYLICYNSPPPIISAWQ